MRDARPQGREVGGARRTRHLARRRERYAIDFGFLLEAFLRVAGAIALDTLAFSIWNLGTRSPARLLREVRERFRERSGLAVEVLRAFVGCVFLLAGSILLVPAITDPQADFAGVETFALLVALGLEHLVGPDLRSLSDPRRIAR